MRAATLRRFRLGDGPPPVEVSLAGLQVLQAEATIAICDTLAALASTPLEQKVGLQRAASSLGHALVQSGLR